MLETLRDIATWLTTSGLKIVGILLGLFILYEMSNRVVTWMEKFVPEKDPVQAVEARKRARTLGKILRHALVIVLVFVALLTILGEVGIQLAPLLATAGIGALAIGFGAQSLVRDVISGFFIILENQFSIGDAVEVAGVSGVVESVNLRTTVLRDLDGRVHTVPNGEIKVVSNLSKEWSRSVLDIGISYRENVDEVIDLLAQIGKELMAEETYRSAILEPPQILGVEKLAESQVVLRMIVKTMPLKQWEVGRELRKRLHRRFKERGIQTPYPHQILIWENQPRGERKL